MNILSFLSAIVFVIYLYMAKNVSPTAERTYRITVRGLEFSLAWWSFCNAFFFAAPTKQAALIWNKLSSFGWISVILFTLLGVCYIAEHKNYIDTCWKKLCMIVPAAAMLLLNLAGNTTSVAVDFTQGVLGLGWAYVNRASNFKYWLFLAYMLVYFGLSIFLLWTYAKKTDVGASKNLSVGLATLDGSLVVICAFTDLILPFFPLAIQPVANIIAVFFGIVFVQKLQKFDFNSIEKAFPASMIIDTSFDPLCIIDTNGIVRFCNKAMIRLFECPEEGLKGCRILDFIVKDERYNRLIEELLLHEKIVSSEVCITTFQKNKAIITLNLTWLFEGSETPRGGIVCLHDITEQAYAREQMQQLAYHDQLTGLSNRLCFNSAVEGYVDEYIGTGRDFAVINLDIDQFKYVNDHYGHHVGDLVLAHIADALRSSIAPEDQAFRMGGDEFLVLAQVEDKAVLDGIIRRITRNLCREVEIDGYMLSLSASVGAALFSERKEIEKTLSLADERMYQSKRAWSTGGKAN